MPRGELRFRLVNKLVSVVSKIKLKMRYERLNSGFFFCIFEGEVET